MRLAILLPCLLVGVLLVAGVATAVPFQTWKRNLEWSEATRSLLLTTDSQGFAFESARDAADAEDVLVGRFSLQKAEYRLDLRNQSGEGEVRTIRVIVSRIIEFRDADNDGAYEATDATLQTWDLEDAILPSLESKPRSDGAYEIVARYPIGDPVEDGGDQPTVELRFHISPHLQSLAGVPVLPTETKFDVSIHGIAYNASDSRLAAEFQVVNQVPALADGEGLETNEGEHRFRFSWEPSATVDGYAQPVGASVVRGSDTTSGVYLSYARGDRMEHDPTVGVHRYEATLLRPLTEALSKGSPMIYLLGLLSAAAVVGTATYVRARRRQ